MMCQDCDDDCDFCEEEMEWLKEACENCDQDTCEECYVNDMIRDQEIERGAGKDPIIFSEDLDI